MKPYFITATGTDVGKTLVTCALVSQLRTKGADVKVIKPVASGFDAARTEESDTGRLLQAQGLALSQSHIDATSPWRFAEPLSPDMAAETEGRHIDFERLITFCHPREGGGLGQDSRLRGNDKGPDYLLIEGIGGAMTPLTAKHTVLDWMAALAFPVILVSGTYLGTLSHTLTSAHAITARNLRLQAVILSESQHSPARPAQLHKSLKHFLPKETLLMDISRLDSCERMWEYVPNLLSILT